MNFYIKKIKLWFHSHPEPKEYEFLPNKVNVITGDSSTGKSSILRVIDYCLMARESTIVEDVINTNVSWYGLSFHLNGRDYVIARKAPTNGRINSDIYWATDTDQFPGGKHPVPIPNISRADIISFLNKAFETPEVQLGEKNKVDFTFRHTLLLNFLTEDIIATANRYLDNLFFEDEEIEEFAASILKICLGSDEKKESALAEMQKELDEKIKKEEQNKTSDERSKQAYENKYNIVVNAAVDLEIIGNGEVLDTALVMTRLKAAIEEFNRIKRSYAKLKELAQLSDQQRRLKEEIDSYRKLRYEYNRAIRYAKKVEDSLTPIEYLEKHLNQQVMSEESIAVFKSLQTAFTSAKKNTLKPDELPKDFEENLQKKKAEYEAISATIRENQSAIDMVFDPNRLVKLVNLVELVRKLQPVHEKYIGNEALNKLKEQFAKVARDYELVSLENKMVREQFLLDVKSYYDQQTGMSASYRGCNVVFDDVNVRLKLLRPDKAFPVRNIGSKSNYMFMHLCFFLGLHQYLSGRESSFVPNFMFIDQPSIPYYGNNGRMRRDAGDLTLQKTDDRSRLEEAFKLINGFMKQNVSDECSFQIIMVEHADPEYWKDLPFFETRYVFTEDRDFGLIPKYVTE